MFLINRTFTLSLMIITSISTNTVHSMGKNFARLGSTARAALRRSLAFAPNHMARLRPWEQDLVNNFDRLSLKSKPIQAIRQVPKHVTEHKIPEHVAQKTPDQKIFHESWSGKDYNQNSEPQLDMGLEVFKKYYVPYIKPNAWVLDAGCGTGRVTKEIAKHVPKGIVVGIDRAHDMITAAQQEGELDDDRLIFKKLDICKLPYKETFDHAISLSCLHWVKDIKKAFKALCDSLKPGGTLLILMEPKNNFPLIKALVEIFGKYNLEIPWYMYEKEDLLNWLKEAGFSMVGSYDFHHEVRFKKEAELAAWLSGIPFAAHLSKAEQTKIINEVVERYVRYEPAHADGIIKLVLPEIVILARK